MNQNKKLEYVECPFCKGYGYIYYPSFGVKGYIPYSYGIECPTCNGNGTLHPNHPRISCFINIELNKDEIVNS